MMKTKKEWMLFVVLVVLGLLAAGCGKTEVPAETPSVMPTAAATLAPAREDTQEPGVPCELTLPASGGWQPTLCETFDDNSHGWQEETQDNPYAAYTSAVGDGRFSVDYLAKSFAGFTRNALTWFDVAEERNFVLSVTGQIESAFSESSWGIAFRGDEDSFFLFSLQNDDSYALEVFEDNRWLPLITRRQTNLIKVGEPNTVRIEASGGDFFFSINGEMVNQSSGATLAGDDILLVVSAKEGASAIFSFDDVLLLK